MSSSVRLALTLYYRNGKAAKLTVAIPTEVQEMIATAGLVAVDVKAEAMLPGIKVDRPEFVDFKRIN